MSKVFISYRRDDSAGYAHAIHSRLLQHFSKDQVFIDVDTVEPGVDFVRVIEEAVGECDVLLALIGKRWGTVSSGATSRLDDPEDFVRLEISTALARDIRVIPVLVDGMTMPSGETLPSSLKPLSRRNAIEISNTRFNFDVERLITTVRKILDATEAKRKAEEEEERNRVQREVEQRRIEAEAQRKLEEERLLDEERQRAEKETREKAEDGNRRRIEEERNRAQQEADRRSLEAESQRKAEKKRLRQQEQQRSEEEAKGKADEANARHIEQEVPSPWRTYGPVTAAVAIGLVIFSLVFWWVKPQEAPIKEPSVQKEPIKETPPVKQEPPPKESVPSALEKKPEVAKEIIKQPLVTKAQPETLNTVTPRKKVETQKEAAPQAPVSSEQHKDEKQRQIEKLQQEQQEFQELQKELQKLREKLPKDWRA